MRAFGAKTLKELVLMQREYSLKGLAEKIECPTLVCDNVGDAVAGGQGKELYEVLRCPEGLRAVHRGGGRRGPLRGWNRGRSSTASPTTGWITRWRRRRRRNRSPATRTSENSVKRKSNFGEFPFHALR